MAFDAPSVVFAALVAGGGIIGYIKAGSVMSLLMGLTSGVLLGLGTYQMSKDPSNYYLFLGVSTFLLAMMGYRFYVTGKFMPAGMVAMLSLVQVVRFGSRLAMK